MFAQSRSKITFVCLHLPNFQLFSETIVNEGSKDQQAKPLEELKCHLKCFELNCLCASREAPRISLEFLVPGCRPNDFQKERWWEKTQHLWTCTSQMSSHFSVWEATRSNQFLRPTKRNCSFRDFWETFETDLQTWITDLVNINCGENLALRKYSTASNPLKNTTDWDEFWTDDYNDINLGKL